MKVSYNLIRFLESKLNDACMGGLQWRARVRAPRGNAPSLFLLFLLAVPTLTIAEETPSGQKSIHTLQRISVPEELISSSEAPLEKKRGPLLSLIHISEFGRTKRRAPPPPRDTEERERRRQVRSADEVPFGRRSFGPLERFRKPLNPDQKWVGYFFEESLAVVLQTSEYLMVDCTVIELRTDKEQYLALQTFGSLMGLVPLSLARMIELIRLCGELPLNNHTETSDFNSKNQGQNSGLILPGTLWCGFKDRAPTYDRVGERVELDKCCRAHDHCPLKVESYEERYGVLNFGFGAKSHCLCEEEFYRCLKEKEDGMADMVGNFYFGIVRAQCLQGPPFTQKLSRQVQSDVKASSTRFTEKPYKCDAWYKEQCRLWAKKKVDYALRLQPFHLKY